MKKRTIILLVLFLLWHEHALLAESSTRLLSISVGSGAEFGSAEAFPPYDANVEARYWLPPLSLSFFDGMSTIQPYVDLLYDIGDFTQFYVGAAAEVGLDSFQDPTSPQTFSAGAIIGANISLLSILSIEGRIDGGYLTALSWPEGSGNGLYIGAKLGLQATLFDVFSITLGGSYSFKNPQRREKLRSFGAHLSATVHIHGAARETIETPFLPPEIFSLYTAYRVTEQNGQEVRERVEVDPGKILGFTNVELESLFPVLHKYYEANSFGNAVIINNTGAPVQNVEVSFYVEEYMSDPWPSAVIDDNLTSGRGDCRPLRPLPKRHPRDYRAHESFGKSDSRVRCW